MQAIADFRRDLSSTPPSEVGLEQLEGDVQDRLNAIGRALMAEVLQHADVTAPEVTINGKRWGNRRESPGTYYFKFGEVRIARSIYSQPGGGPIAIPLQASERRRQSVGVRASASASERPSVSVGVPVKRMLACQRCRLILHQL
jgi:hypothetical protein